MQRAQIPRVFLLRMLTVKEFSEAPRGWLPCPVDQRWQSRVQKSRRNERGFVSLHKGRCFRTSFRSAVQDGNDFKRDVRAGRQSRNWETLRRSESAPAEALRLAASFSSEDVSPHGETALVDVKEAFRQLQADRHRADYDLAWNIVPTDVEDATTLAEVRGRHGSAHAGFSLPASPRAAKWRASSSRSSASIYAQAGSCKASCSETLLKV
jgi:hypothetical protein